MESAESLGLVGSTIVERGKRQTSNTKGTSSVSRVHGDSVTDTAKTIESETPEVCAVATFIHNYC